ncbi:M24 family metallopeptidase [Thermodesulforhabdus norvegica]|uniref:Xaa-Pro aminopeptidase n=1 Tax=Thermodesulforhabdus norvegica TaxID=39841 RepID=A0A1I4RBZ3_9BACT|nr:Xaa-Pro peptidase family protein [Thermodesulforhabdus norvegica]SFM49824.1 Xaa-Pro aminopeptidase [Thermodesulforhabdus norvegica]
MKEARIEKVRKWMASAGLDAFIVTEPENRYYLSGFSAEDPIPSEISGFLLITETELAILTDARYGEQAEGEAPDFDVLLYGNEGACETVARVLAESGAKRCAFEDHHLSVETFRAISDALKEMGKSVEFVPARRCVEGMRAVKDEEEIELIRESLQLTESVMEEVLHLLGKGLSERDIAWFTERRMRETGAEALAFPPIVASGPRSALPHASPTHRIPGLGEPVVIDIGARKNRYCSDMTRTFFLGQIPRKWIERYKIVREAQMAAQEAIKPGIMTDQVDRIARKIIEDAGYGDLFGHGLGHGVGLAVHELPRLRKSSSTMLEPNMIVTVEPGIYFKGEGGIRLENMVRVTEGGFEILNRKSLFILED